MKREKKKHCRNNSKIKLINIVERAKIDSPNLVHDSPNLVHISPNLVHDSPNVPTMFFFLSFHLLFYSDPTCTTILSNTE
jgi:hypothetical protein